MELLEKVVRGVGEYVGLSVKAPPASDIVSVREALRLGPHDEVEPEASEKAILEGALYWVLGSCSAPPFIKKWRDEPLAPAFPDFSWSSNPAAANALAVRGPSHSAVGLLEDMADDGLVGGAGV